MKKSFNLFIAVSAFTLLSMLVSLAAKAFNQFSTNQVSELQLGQQAQGIPIAGTRVKLVPPVGFTASSQFPGYIQESTSASIVVTEFPGSFSEVSATFLDAKKLAQKNFILLNQEEVIINGQKGILVELEQKADGQEFLTWILIFGNEKEAVLIVASLPKLLENPLSEHLKTSLLSSRWEQDKIVSPTEGLNFTIVESGNLKLAQRLGNTLLYSKEGIFPNQNIDDPIFIVGESLGKVIINNQEDFAKNRLQETASVTELKIKESKKIVIDELNGYEIIAQGKDTESGEPMTVYQTILFSDNSSYYIMQGIVSLKSQESSLTTFQTMAKSFKRTKINP